MHLKALPLKTIPMSIHIANAVEHVLPFWLMAGIQIITKRRAEERIKQEYDTWGSLCESKKHTCHPKGKRQKLYCFIGFFMRYWSCGCHRSHTKKQVFPSEKNEEILHFILTNEAKGTLL